MDKQLLEALNNIGNALEQLAQALSNKNEDAKSPVSNALLGGDFGKKLETISVDIKNIKSNTDKILQNQDYIISLYEEKKSKDTEVFESSGKKDNVENIKGGVGTILLIAGAVLAIGMAFKLVGTVDVVSVMSLAIAIGIISTAFVKIIESEGLSVDRAKEASIALVLMSTGVALASIPLSLVVPVPLNKLGTALAISGIMAFASYSMSLVMKNLSESGGSNLAKNTLILTFLIPAIATSLTVSSFILSFSKDVSPSKLLTSLALSGVLLGISYSMPGVIKALSELDGLGIATNTTILLFLIPAIATSLAITSYILSLTSEISPAKLLTAIAVSASFAIIIPYMAQSVEGMEYILNSNSILEGLPFLMFSISTGILLSSLALSFVRPVSPAKMLTSIIIGAGFSYMIDPISKAIERMSNLSPDQIIAGAFFIPLIFPAIATGITLSSWLLSLVKPVSFAKMLTATIIGVGFSYMIKAIAQSIKILSELSKDQIERGAIVIPIIFPAMSLGIVMSSYLLNFIKPVSLGKILTATIIGLGLTAIVRFIAPSIKDIEKIEYGQVIKLGTIFTILSTAIAISSNILSLVEPLSFGKLVTVTILALALSVMVRVLEPTFDKIDKIEYKQAIKLGVIFTILSIAVAASSNILALSADMPISKITGIILLGIGLSVMAVAMSFALLILKNMNPADIVKGGISIVLISGVVMASSLILAMGKYDKYPTIDWIKGVAATFITFGIAMTLLGMAVFGPQALLFAAGLAAIFPLAGSIVLVSKILSTGTYENGPTAEWAEGIAKSIAAYMPVFKMVGNGLLNLFGSGGPSISDFNDGIILISEGIVKTANIFSEANSSFEAGPSEEWADGVSSAIGAFMPVYKILTDGIFAMLTMDKFEEVLNMVTRGIVNSAKTFSKANASFENVPNEEWGKGVSKAIGAFIPVYELLSGAGFLGMDISPDKFSNLVEVITMGIVGSARQFSKLKAAFNNPPSEEWGKGVSKSIGAFIPVYELLTSDGIFGKTVSPDQFSNLVTVITAGITDSARQFGEYSGSFANPPSEEWGRGVSKSIAAFIPIFELLTKPGIFRKKVSPEEFSNLVKTITGGITDSAKQFGEYNGSFNNPPNEEWGTGVSKSIAAFIPIFELLTKPGIFRKKVSPREFSNLVTTITGGIINSAKQFSEYNGAFNNPPSLEWGEGVSSSIGAFVPIFEILTNPGIFSKKVSPEEFTNIVKTITGGIIESANNFSKFEGSFKNPPSEDWGKGVSAAIGAFMPIYKMLNDGSVMAYFFGGFTPEDFNKAVVTISMGIVEAGKAFGSANTSFSKVPNKEWGEGVSKAIGAFLPVYKMLDNDSFLNIFNSGYTPEDFKNSVVIITEGIVESANKFSNSDVSYEKYPNVEWSSGVSKAIGAFLPVYEIMNEKSAISFLTTGFQASDFKRAIVIITEGIVESANKFSNSDVSYEKYPSVDWSSGVSMAIGAFLPVYELMNEKSALSFLTTGFQTSDFKRAILIITDGIVESANRFAKAKAVYTDYPKYEWSEGVGKAIGAFLPVYKIMSESSASIFMGSSLNVKDFKKAILIITDGIVESANRFAGLDVSYGNYPKEEWSTGVGLAIGAFLPVYKLMAESSSFLGSKLTPKDFKKAIIGITEGIVYSARTLYEGEVAYGVYPSKDWSLGVAGSISAFSSVFDILGKNSNLYSGSKKINAIASGIKMISQGIADSAKSFSGYMWDSGSNSWIRDIDVNWSNYPTAEWSQGVAESIRTFTGAYEDLEKSPGIYGGGSQKMKNLGKSIILLSQGLADSSRAFSGYVFDEESKKWIKLGDINWTGYPSKEWVSGVTDSFRAFGKIYDEMNSGRSLFQMLKGGFKYKDIKGAVVLMANSISEVASIFSENSGAFGASEYPNKEWNEGVTNSFKSIIAIYEEINSKSKILDPSLISEGEGSYNSIIKRIVKIISEAAIYFNESGASFSEENFPGSDWTSSFDKLIKSQISLVENISNGDVSFKTIESGSYLISKIINNILKYSDILAKNSEILNFKLDSDFIDSIKKNVMGFVELTKEVASSGIEDYLPSGGVLGFITGAISDYFSVGKEMGLVERVVSSLVNLAKMLYDNSEYLSGANNYGEFSNIISKNGIISNFLDLTQRIGEYGENFKFAIPNRIANSLVNMSKILNEGRESFSLKIDPNYVSNISKNILDFSELLNQIKENNMFGDIGFFSGTLFGSDPISKIAKGMVILSKGYNKLADSLTKLSVAMKSLNMDDIKMLGGMYRETSVPNNINLITNADSESNNINSIGGTFSSFNSIGSVNNSIGEPKTLDEKMDRMIELLSIIAQTNTSVDTTFKELKEDQDPKGKSWFNLEFK